MIKPKDPKTHPPPPPYSYTPGAAGRSRISKQYLCRHYYSGNDKKEFQQLSKSKTDDQVDAIIDDIVVTRKERATTIWNWNENATSCAYHYDTW
jgi:hypothetical protein